MLFNILLFCLKEYSETLSGFSKILMKTFIFKDTSFRMRHLLNKMTVILQIDEGLIQNICRPKMKRIPTTRRFF